MYNDDIVTDNSLENYIKLYNKGDSVRSINPLKNEHYRIFSLSNADVRIIDRDKVNELLIPLSKLHYFVNDHVVKDIKTGRSIFMKGNRFFYMIPIQSIRGNIISFSFRRVFDTERTNKHYSLNSSNEDYNKSAPIFFGWYKDFEKFDFYSKNGAKAIALCEGIKDCIYLKQFYPYVLALNGSSINAKGASFLRYLTNKVVFIPDTDKPGMDAYYNNDANLKKVGFFTRKIKLDEGIKDAASYINHPNLEYAFKTRFLKILEKLEDDAR